MRQDRELASYFKRMYDVLNTGDVGAIDTLLSSDAGTVGIGTDPREWWTGDEVKRALKTQPAEMHAAGVRFQPGDIRAQSEGSVGWIADRPSLKTADGKEVPLRVTAVCHQEDGQWKIAQLHMSIGVANEETIGEELTI